MTPNRLFLFPSGTYWLMLQSNMQWGWQVQSDSTHRAHLCNPPDGKEWLKHSFKFSLMHFTVKGNMATRSVFTRTCVVTFLFSFLFFSSFPLFHTIKSLYSIIFSLVETSKLAYLSCLSFFFDKAKEVNNKEGHAPPMFYPSLFFTTQQQSTYGVMHPYHIKACRIV